MNASAIRISKAATMAFALAGCVSYTSQETQTIETLAVSENRPDCVSHVASHLGKIRHAQPLVGLFIGISNYDEISGFSPTPAHTISAAMFREPFFVTAAGGGQKNDLKLVTTMRLDPRSNLARDAERTLRGVGGMLVELIAPPDAKPGAAPLPGEWEYVRNSQATTHQRLLDSIEQSLERAEAVAQERGSVVFILYVSAHGRLGADGRAYVMPSDADKDAPQTWLDQQQVLSKAAAFLARSRSDGRSRKAVLVFDICRVPQGELPEKLTVGVPRAIPNAFVVESTSPGSYAWHWTMESETHEELNVDSESRLGFPFPPPKTQAGVIDKRFAANMSVAPLASTCAISDFFTAQAKAGVATQPAVVAAMNVSDWLRASAKLLPSFTRDIAEVRATHAHQEMQLFAPSTLPTIPLLEVGAR